MTLPLSWPRSWHAPRRAGLLLGIVALLVVTATGCGGTSKASGKPAADRLAAAQKYLDSSKSVTISLSTPKLPQGVQGILKAIGVGTKAPAFKGKISVVRSGLNIEVPVISVDGAVYIQFAGSWQKIDPAKFGAPDPANLFQPGTGLSSLLSDVKGAKPGKDIRQGKDVLSTISGTVPGAKVASIIPTASATSDFATTFVLDDKDHLVTAVLSGPFYPDAGDVTYTIGFSRYGSPASIKAP
ncbi:MAG: LppX_LprAFG lipoprotein [Marmoricola sp.]